MKSKWNFVKIVILNFFIYDFSDIKMEVIIVDDASPDGTQDQVKDL